MKLIELKQVRGTTAANELLSIGWQLVQVGSDNSYHLGRYAQDAEEESAYLPNWPTEAAKWLSQLEPTEIDKVVLDHPDWRNEGLTGGVLKYLCYVLVGDK